MERHLLPSVSLQGSLKPLPARTALKLLCPHITLLRVETPPRQRREARSGTAPPAGPVPCRIRLTGAVPGASCGSAPDPDPYPHPHPGLDPALGRDSHPDPGPAPGLDPAPSPQSRLRSRSWS